MKVLVLIVLVYLLSSCKESNEQLFNKAYKAAQNKKYTEAITFYTQILKQNSKLQRAFYNRGLCYMQLQDYPKALYNFNRIIALQQRGEYMYSENPNSPLASYESKYQVPFPEAMYQRGQVYYELDSLKKSFTDFQVCIKNNFETTNCLLWQGQIWLKTGTPAKACNFFIKAQELGDSKANELLKTYCKQ